MLAVTLLGALLLWVKWVCVVCVAEGLERIEYIWVSRRCQVRVKIKCRAKQRWRKTRRLAKSMY